MHFSSKDEALKFKSRFTGELKNFDEALKIANENLTKKIMKFLMKRSMMAKKGKRFLKLCVIQKKRV